MEMLWTSMLKMMMIFSRKCEVRCMNTSNITTLGPEGLTAVVVAAAVAEKKK